jgi:hypothetical protein
VALLDRFLRGWFSGAGSFIFSVVFMRINNPDSLSDYAE